MEDFIRCPECYLWCERSELVCPRCLSPQADRLPADPWAAQDAIENALVEMTAARRNERIHNAIMVIVVLASLVGSFILISPLYDADILGRRGIRRDPLSYLSLVFFMAATMVVLGFSGRSRERYLFPSMIRFGRPRWWKTLGSFIIYPAVLIAVGRYSIRPTLIGRIPSAREYESFHTLRFVDGRYRSTMRSVQELTALIDSVLGTMMMLAAALMLIVLISGLFNPASLPIAGRYGRHTSFQWWHPTPVVWDKDTAAVPPMPDPVDMGESVGSGDAVGSLAAGGSVDVGGPTVADPTAYAPPSTFPAEPSSMPPNDGSEPSYDDMPWPRND